MIWTLTKFSVKKKLMDILLTLLSTAAIIFSHIIITQAAENNLPTFSGKPYDKTPDLDINIPKDLDNNLPELGDISQTVLSPQDEQRIAQQILRDISVSDDVVQDVEIVDYLQALGARLVAASDDKLQVFSFFVVQDNSINAFAMPGGVIGVHTGLILAANSESELASVLGHEIGHVTQHHLARMLAKQKTDTFKNIAGIAVALLMARANPELASGALATSSAATIQRQLDYTRENEREADRVGLSIMQNAGFDPRAMPAFFNTLQRGTRFVEGSAPSFLRTHPLTSERIADVENRVASMPYKQVTSSFDFFLVRAKLRANNGLAQSAIDQFQQNIKDGRFANETAEHYGLAVAMLRKNDVAGAANQMQWLTAHRVNNAMVANLGARVEVARNNPQAAAKQYAAALKTFPNSRAITHGYAEHFLAVNQPDKAIDLIHEKQATFTNDAYSYELLARAYQAQGKDLLRYQAQGESYYRQYDLPKAVEQMGFAVKAKDGSFYEKSIVEARLKQLQREESLQKEDKS